MNENHTPRMRGKSILSAAIAAAMAVAAPPVGMSAMLYPQHRSTKPRPRKEKLTAEDLAALDAAQAKRDRKARKRIQDAEITP